MLRVPLQRNFRELAGQIVFAGEHGFAGTHGAAAAGAGAGADPGLPFVAVFAAPPDLPPGTGRDLRGRQSAVFQRVPLSGQVRISRSKIVHTRQHHPVGTDGTAAPADPGVHLGLPAVAIGTEPPDLPAAAAAHIRRRQAAVADRVPLRQKRGVPQLSAVFF